MPTRYLEKKRPTFSELSRHKRRDAVVALKGQMRREAREYGGAFTSELMMREPGRPDLYCQSFDFYFPGAKPWMLWNASIITAKKALWEAAHDKAHTILRASMRESELEREHRVTWVPADVSSTGKILSYFMEKEDISYPRFDGRTYFEQWEHLTQGIIRSDPPPVYESFQIDADYRYGVGLHIVLDVAVINQQSIELAIRAFKAMGEQAWIASVPVPRENLPQVSEHEALAEHRRLTDACRAQV